MEICGPFTPTTLGGYRYFITFTDDFSSYRYVELIHEKSDSLIPFKEFKVKMELQKNKKLKIVRSDIGGEFYCRYDETRRTRGHSQFIYASVALMHNIQCLALLNIMA